MPVATQPDFPIVGVGASAGGLDAYRQLLTALPGDTGAAYVFVQHLDPNHDSMMADLLSKYTSMPVLQADQNMPVAPNHVYIIPPNKFIKLVDHGLFLEEPIQERGIRMSIDHFLRSMADVRSERSIGILLSGTGSDGSLGMREIKAAGGLVIVQDPKTAEYDGMPRAAINTGTVDFILPIEEIPQILVNFMNHPYLAREERETTILDESPDHFRSILNLLRAHTDYDFRCYKKGTLERRIQRRMGLRQVADLEEYLGILRESPNEVTQLFKDLLIGVTRFFRDLDAWEELEKKAISHLIQRKQAGEPLRAWIPGCASGEEAYTATMILCNQIELQNKRIDLQVFATDLNEDAITAARAGVYPAAISTDVPSRYLKKYFTQDGDCFRVNKRLRETVIFATQNVISDPPFSKIDLISCRNLMIYLEPEIQRRMIEMFHFALAGDSFLFLGPSESGERPGRLFEAVSKPHRIYKKSATVRNRPGSFPIIPSRERPTIKDAANDPGAVQSSNVDLAKRILLDRFAPASVLIDRRFEVQYFHGPVRNYLDFPTGEPTSDLTDIALDGLRSKLRGALAKVLETKEPSTSTARNVRRNGHQVNVRITVEPLKNPSGEHFLILVVFEDESEPQDYQKVQKRREAAKPVSPEDESLVHQLEYELQATKEDLQSTIEEMETANEELKASNEEVMSMNEELQSTNEELETSREELQSLNEELSTVNSQLEEKVTEVEAANNDLVNLLRSTNIATIFLDTQFCIRRFTPATRELMRIIDSDIGRPIEDLASRVNDPDLYSDSQRVLEKLQPSEKEVSNEEGHHFIRRVQPYRTADNKIEGVVVTFTDVTRLREAAEATRKRELQQQATAQIGELALADEPLEKLFHFTVDKLAKYLDVPFAKILKLEPDGSKFQLIAGCGWKEGYVGKAEVDAGTGSQAGYTLQRASPVIVDDFAKDKRFVASPLLTDHGVVCGASVAIGPSNGPWGILGAYDAKPGTCPFDVDDINFMQAVSNILWLAISQQRAQEAIECERRELRDLIDAMPFQLAIISQEQLYLMVNRAYSEWGGKPEDIEGRTIEDVLGKATYRQARPAIEAVLDGESQRYELQVIPPNARPGTRLVNYTPRRDQEGKVTGFYSAAIDISSQKAAEGALAERTAQYRTIGESIPFGVWICDAQGRLDYVSQSFLDMVGMTNDDAIKFGWADKLVPDTAEDTLAAWQACVASGADWECEHQFVNAAGGITTVLAIGRPIRNESGEITSWAGLNLDMTERKKNEERGKIISAELDHRVKNILATISSIARLSGRSAKSLEAFRTNFEARIQALARAHQTLAQTKWDGMKMAKLVANEINPYAPLDSKNIVIDGPDVLLLPSAAQSMSLVLHELVTNAVKYGALQSAGGKLSISWDIRTGKEPELHFRWVEKGLAGIKPPKEKGFGTTVITSVIQGHCDAVVDLDFRPTGLQYELSLPVECFRWNPDRR